MTYTTHSVFLIIEISHYDGDDIPIRRQTLPLIPVFDDDWYWWFPFGTILITNGNRRGPLLLLCSDRDDDPTTSVMLGQGEDVFFPLLLCDYSTDIDVHCCWLEEGEPRRHWWSGNDDVPFQRRRRALTTAFRWFIVDIDHINDYSYRLILRTVFWLCDACVVDGIRYRYEAVTVTFGIDLHYIREVLFDHSYDSDYASWPTFSIYYYYPDVFWCAYLLFVMILKEVFAMRPLFDVHGSDRDDTVIPSDCSDRWRWWCLIHSVFCSFFYTFCYSTDALFADSRYSVSRWRDDDSPFVPVMFSVLFGIIRLGEIIYSVRYILFKWRRRVFYVGRARLLVIDIRNDVMAFSVLWPVMTEEIGVNEGNTARNSAYEWLTLTSYYDDCDEPVEWRWYVDDCCYSSGSNPFIRPASKLTIDWRKVTKYWFW